MRIGTAVKRLGFQTCRKHALRIPPDDFVGCGFAWLKEGDSYQLELDVWLSDAYSVEQPALIGVDVPRFLLSTTGLIPYEGFTIADRDDHLFTDFESLRSAVEDHFNPWADKWTKLQTLIDFYVRQEGITETVTDFPEVPWLDEHKAPVNCYHLALLNALRGDFDEAGRWTIEYERRSGYFEELSSLKDIKSGHFRKQPFSYVEL
jgi:hypothetical protein